MFQVFPATLWKEYLRLSDAIYNQTIPPPISPHPIQNLKETDSLVYHIGISLELLEECIEIFKKRNFLGFY